MSDYVTRTDLSEAISVVTADIRDTEARLRDEFTGTVRFEVNRMDSHLESQDATLKTISRGTIGSLTTLVVSLLGSIIYILIHFIR